MTGFGIAGVAITAIESVKAAKKAEYKIQEIEQESKTELTDKEKLNSTWSIYVPSIFWGLATMSCILSTNIININNQAALAGAYSIIENSYHSYTDAVKEIYGEEAHQKVVSHIVAQKAEKRYIYSTDWLGSSLSFDDDDEVQHLFYLECADKFFVSTTAAVLEAEYHINKNFMYFGEVSLYNLMDFLGLTDDMSKEDKRKAESVGWDNYNGDLYWIVFNHFKTDRIDLISEACPDGVVRVIQTPYWPTEPYGEALELQ